MYLHQEEDDLPRDVSRDPIDVHVTPPGDHVDQLVMEVWK